MNEQQALGFLIAGAINQALRTTWDHPENVAACCPNCCGPCAALQWFYANDPGKADAAVASIMHDESDGYGWQLTSRGIDWKVMLQIWNRGRDIGCCKKEDGDAT